MSKAASIAASPPLPRIEGFELLEKIADGRQSTLYRACDRQGQPCAVKVLTDQAARDRRLLTRFYAAAKAPMIIDHPRVLDVWEVNQVGNRHVQVMEYVEQGSLASHLNRCGTLPEPAALRLIALVAEALDRTHASGFVHRDVVPEGVLLTPSFDPVLGRFGLVYNYGGRQDLTDVWGGPGAMAYASPQLLRSSTDVDPTDDLYSLGVLLYRCLTGLVPFEGCSLQWMLEQKEGDPRAIVAPLQGVSPQATDLLAACLAPRREDRPQTAAEVATAAASALGQSLSSYWSGEPHYTPATKAARQRWFLLVPDKAGNLRLVKATIEQITFRLRRGALDANVLAAPSLAKAFRPLHQCSAFRPLFADSALKSLAR